MLSQADFCRGHRWLSTSRRASAALQSPVLCAFAVRDCLDAGRLRGSLLLRCRVMGRMARAGGCLSEHVGLVNSGAADSSRGLHTVSLPYMAFRTVPHVYVTGDQYNVYCSSLTFSHTSKYESTRQGCSRGRSATNLGHLELSSAKSVVVFTKKTPKSAVPVVNLY